ncbi:helix-turn-helix domain-containing protein [Geomonas sp. RF6]|uniref:helix-turn-helix domain-containing protein n=1 Tax=Geomonas sp. RF6 TaxID=2897342 RepID=UPI001E287870|nr:helix-turn-helix transcriptional regulator [Geomonas sp. RF6]UFS71764.1 helix-turn-helix domain-containing protein [Geomonas sp. RF6]
MDKILDTKEIGGKIRMLRKHAGLSQERLAELVGVSFQQIQKYENGSTMLNTDKLQRVANALKVPPSAFFDESTYEKPPLSDRETMLVKAFRTLEDEVIQEGIVKLMVRAGEK